MSRRIVHTDEAPEAIGPYSQAVIYHDMVYTAGQIGLDPATGKLVGDDVESQCERALDNLQAVLKAAGSSFKDVIKATVYLADMGDFPLVNKIYGMRFGEQPPARAAIQAAALPLGARVEIDMIAAVSEDEPVW